MVISNGIIHPMDGPVIPSGFVTWEGERITNLGPMEALPKGDLGKVLDARGGHVTPGYIDAHCHLGVLRDSRPYDDARLNAEGPISPDFQVLDALDLHDRCFAEALAAGVTTVAVAPGSANPVGGQVACLKTGGDPERRVIQPLAALKMALGETPERTCRTDAGGLYDLLRTSLAAATHGPLAAVRGGDLSVHLHAHRASDLQTALALAREFGWRLVLVHGTDACQMAQAIADAGVPVITGPAMTDRSKAELKNACLEAPAALARAGVKTAVCTDHPETPAQYLPLCAALAVRGGMEEETALAAITLAPAEILGLGERLGSLTVGKEADIVLTPGHPFDPRSCPSAVILNGKQVL